MSLSLPLLLGVEFLPGGLPVTSERDPTITDFLNDFRGGNSNAFDELWNHYFCASSKTPAGGFGRGCG